jgi:dTMP kinase
MFIVFEGIDGSGKTTVSNKVAAQLRQTGLVVEHLREGGKFSSSVTQAIRELGRDARNLDLTPQAELFLYVTRDVQLIDEAIRPALARADVVIADRFLYSAEILARHGRGLPEDLVRPVLTAAAGGLEPDLVILIDVDPTIARARRKVAKRRASVEKPPSRKGLGGAGMQQRFATGYRALAAQDARRWIVVDNDADLDATVAHVFALVSAAVRTGVPAARALATQAAVPAPEIAPLANVEQALPRFLAIVDRRAAREPHVAAYLLAGLHGPGVDERRLALVDRAAETLLEGLDGLIDPVSWEIRETLAARAPGAVARSLRGPASLHPRAEPLRAALNTSVPADLLVAFEGAAHDDAWVLRERLRATAPRPVLESLVGLDDPRAWTLREDCLAAVGGEAAIHVDAYENARSLCRSLTSVEHDRAWHWREIASAAAPIAALASIKALASDKAWAWRRRYLGRAPKTVFETMVAMDDARAWPMRDQAAPMVKEAIDSLYGLDSPAAWRLREACADVWPSTVVKSLGVLAATLRGRTLLERQLAHHSENLSLLKHASAIAVGAHTDPAAASE